MAEVVKDDKNEVVKVTYRDTAGYTAEVDKRSPVSGAIRIMTKRPDGGGAPTDLSRDEARKFFRDGLDLVGEGD